MAGDNVIQGAQPVEYVEESTFATEEVDGDYNWFGIVNSWSATQGVNSESITYLPEYGASNKLEKRSNVKLSEMWEGEVTYHPQDMDMLQYFTGSDGGTSDSVTSIQVGEVNESGDTDEYRRLMGGVGEEFSLTVSEDSVAEVSGSFTFADGTDWSTDDYIDTDSGDSNSGSHATEDTTEPLSYKDLGNVTYGGSALPGAVEEITLNVSNSLAVVKDADANRDSKIASIVPTDREITLDVSLTYDGFDMAQEVRSYTPKDFTFDLGSYSFTVSGVQFPEFPYEFTADDLVSDSISSDPADSLTWTSA